MFTEKHLRHLRSAFAVLRSTQEIVEAYHLAGNTKYTKSGISVVLEQIHTELEKEQPSEERYRALLKQLEEEQIKFKQDMIDKVLAKPKPSFSKAGI